MKKLWDKQLGSQWRKWDLHIHSTYSMESRAKLTVKDIFKSAIEKEISVIAVTDHSNVKALDEIWNTYNDTFKVNDEQYKYKDYINFIPGVELKTDKGNKPIHLIALFPKEINMGTHIEKVDKNFLESNFLSKIGCSDSDVRAAGFGDYNKGLLDCTVDFEETCNLVHELGGIIIVHNGTKHGGFDQGLSHAPTNEPTDEELEGYFNGLKQKLMTNCVDICEIPNAGKSNLRDRDFYLKRFGKPCIISSDSHDTYEGAKFSWIKADPSLEGLKQVLFEPQYRLHLGESAPFNPVHKIESLEIDFPTTTMIGNEKFCIAPQTTINFSPNLTCLIGGRGSGKSTILNLLHEKLQPGKNNFFKKYKVNLPKDKHISDYVQIDGDQEEKQIEFFSQNEIEEFALDFEKFTETIYPRITKLGNNSTLISASENLDKYLQGLDNHIDNLQKMHTLTVRASNLEKKKKAQENIVSSLNDETYLEMSRKLDEKDKEVRHIKASKRKYEDLLKSFEEIIKENEVHKVINEYDQQRADLIQAIKLTIKQHETVKDFSTIDRKLIDFEGDISSLKIELNKYLEGKGLTDENLFDVASATEEINRLDSLLLEVNSELQNTKKTIESFVFDSSLKEIFVREIESKIEEQNQSLLNLSTQVKPITLKYEFNREKAKQRLLQIKMKDFSTEESFQNLRQIDLEKYLFCLEPEQISTKDVYLNALQQVSSSKTKSSSALVEYFSDDVKFETFKLEISKILSDVNSFKVIRVYYDGKPLENTSFGQRCTAAIILLIKLGNKPIIIDEPEAHLDSMLVANYLVDLIKESKQQRQIIFATHNANFAINGDAELINILEADVNTKVISTTIENLKYRDKLLQLEGGKVAFETREKKYMIR